MRLVGEPFPCGYGRVARHSEPVNASDQGGSIAQVGGAAGSESAMTFAVQVNILSMTNRRSEALTPEP